MNQAANQLLRKQELERNQILQRVNQPDTVAQDDKNYPQKYSNNSFVINKVPSQQVAIFEFSKSTPFIFRAIREREKNYILRMQSALLKI